MSPTDILETKAVVASSSHSDWFIEINLKRKPVSSINIIGIILLYSSFGNHIACNAQENSEIIHNLKNNKCRGSKFY